MKAQAVVTWERVNEQEAEAGDTERRGCLARGLTLREALGMLGEDMDETESIDLSATHAPRWLTVTGRNWTDGDSVSNSLFVSPNPTGASWGRIVRVLKRGRF